MGSEMTFSVNAMRHRSGTGSDDRQFAEFFCREAVVRARSAASRLTSIADLVVWSDNVRAESESLLGLITAMHSTVKDFTEFFVLKPEFAAVFQRTLPLLAEHRKIGKEAMEKISAWL